MIARLGRLAAWTVAILAAGVMAADAHKLKSSHKRSKAAKVYCVAGCGVPPPIKVYPPGYTWPRRYPRIRHIETAPPPQDCRTTTLDEPAYRPPLKRWQARGFGIAEPVYGGPDYLRAGRPRITVCQP